MDNQRIQVLLVERDPVYCDQVARFLLQNFGNVVVDQREYLPFAHELKKDFPDVILIDPFEGEEDLEGRISEFKTLYPHTHVVYITKNRDPEAIIEGFRLGVTDYLLKPFQEEDFRIMFQRVAFALRFRDLPALEGIFQVCQQLNLCRSISRFFYILSLYIAKILNSKRFIVLYRGPGARKFEVLHTFGIQEKKEKMLKHLVNQGPTEFLEIRELLTLVMSEHLPNALQKIESNTNYLFVAFGDDVVGRGILGFEVGQRSRESLTPLFPNIEELLNESGIIFSNLITFLKVRDFALRDDLTGLYNMRSFKSLVEKEFKAADERGYPVSALFMDIDDFKKVNDAFGHLVGSKVLKEVGEILKKTIRTGELIYRYGGDEFVMILPSIGLDEAKVVGERIRVAIASHTFETNVKDKIRLTVSIGIATYPEQARDLNALLKIADQAMYHSKKGSKNMVYVAEKSK